MQCPYCYSTFSSKGDLYKHQTYNTQCGPFPQQKEQYYQNILDQAVLLKAILAQIKLPTS